jgi:aminomethyltransferase
MQKTRLYDDHVALGGRMVDFAGWALPVQYSAGPTAEHHAVRKAAGLFDIDHMAQYRLTGPDTYRFLQALQVRDLEQAELYHAYYSLLTYADGTIVDDIFLYHLPERWLIVGNASNREKDLAWMQAHARGYNVSLTDISDETHMLALQGPKAEAILARLTTTDLSSVAARSAVEAEVAGVQMLLGRTGYTGEDGFEIYLPDRDVIAVWEALLAAGKEDGLLPCGLAARDSLRFEACMPLYGHEIDASINPLEARLGWVIDWNKDFVGRDALLKTKLEKPQRLLIGFEMVDRAVAREHYSIAVEGREVGYVTSGMKSPTLGKFLGLGYVPRAFTKIGTELEIMVRGQAKKARVIKRPFYRSHYKED